MAGWGNSWDLVTTVSKVLELKEGETTCLEVLLENKEHIMSTAPSTKCVGEKTATTWEINRVLGEEIEGLILLIIFC